MNDLTFSIFESMKSKRANRHERVSKSTDQKVYKSTYYQCNRSDERYLIIDAIEWCLTTASRVTFFNLNSHINRIYKHECCGYVDTDKCARFVWDVRSLGSDALKSKQGELKAMQKAVA